MKIDRQNKRVLYSTMKVGEVFEYYDGLYMVTDEVDGEGELKSVNLKSGEIRLFETCDDVLKVNVKIVDDNG